MGCVYLLHDSGRGLYRLGCTGRLRDRIRQHFHEAKGELRFVWFVCTDDKFRLEKYLQEQWADRRREGEWFDLLPEHVRFFKGATTVEYHDTHFTKAWESREERERLAAKRSRRQGPVKQYHMRIGEVVTYTPKKGKK